MPDYFEALKTTNFWDGGAPETGVPRPAYTSRLKNYMNNRLAKVLVGQRRCGKSVVLRQVMAGLLADGVGPRQIFYLDKERMEFADLTDARQLHELILHYRKRLRVKGRVYLFLDEVQQIEGWERLVNACTQDRREEYEVFVTGSNSRMLSTELGSLLTGRYVPFEILPFSFREYAAARRLEPDKETLLAYLQAGGLPELLYLQSEESRRHYVAALRDAILLNDVVRRHRIKDPDLLSRLFRYVCDNCGTLVSVNKIVATLGSNGLKTNFETVSNYLSHLCQAMVIHECPRYDIRGKALLAGVRKYYVNDLAFRQYLSSGFEPALSRRLENLLYLQFRSQGCQAYVGASRNLEVDFVVEKDGARSYYQVCYLLSDPAVIEREFRGLAQIKDNYPKRVVSLDDVGLGNRNGIEHLQLWQML